ncbi:MAG: ammonium transporter, partial [Gammaproteobacteria bacterium]
MPLALLALAAFLVLPASALATADDLQQAIDGKLGETVPINTMWVVVAAVFVLLMQAGFAMLEIGFSRAKNAGTGVAKILTNLSIAAICYWAVGFAFAFGSADVLGISGLILGSNGFFLQLSGSLDPETGGHLGLPVMSVSNATVEAKFLFQFAFLAVSLAIVWGSTLERIKYGAYVIYAIVFASIIYPIGSHWVFGGGWLQNGDTPLLPTGMQDFAGSTVIHLIGATGALAALLLIGPRRGKYGPDGKPRAIPGHSMPLVGLGTLILFIGWFGFNAGSTLGVTDVRFAEVAMITLLGACGGVLGAFVMGAIK